MARCISISSYIVCPVGSRGLLRSYPISQNCQKDRKHHQTQRTHTITYCQPEASSLLCYRGEYQSPVYRPACPESNFRTERSMNSSMIWRFRTVIKPGVLLRFAHGTLVLI